MTNTPNKENKKKWIYIGVGLVIFIAIAVGAIFLWKRSKIPAKSDSDNEEENALEELPKEITEYRNKDWVNKETGINDYKIPKKRLPKNISVARAKDEILEAIWQWSNKTKKKKEIARILEKNTQRINLADKEEKENQDPLFWAKFMDKVGKKYQQDIFFSQPNQEKFGKGIEETRTNFYYLMISFMLKYKNNKKIDWKASLRWFTEGKVNKTKTEEKEDFEKVVNYVEREAINPFITDKALKFPSLTSLKELNQWTNTMDLKECIGSKLAFDNYFRAQEIGKIVPSPGKKEGQETIRYTNIKNEKFNLNPVVVIFKLQGQE